MTTQLYKDAVIEAKKLKEIAEEDAKQQILEKIAPLVRKHISENLDSTAQFFFEQDDELEVPESPEGAEGQPPAVQAQAPAAGEVATSELQTPTATDNKDMSAPLSNQDEPLNVSLPDEEGKITVDFEDLFKSSTADNLSSMNTSTDSASMASAETLPAPEEDSGEGLEMSPDEMSLEPTIEDDENQLQGMAPTSEAIDYKDFRNSLLEVSQKIDDVYFGGNSKDIVKESLKNKLFSLLEQLDHLKENEKIDSKKAKLSENRLQYLYLKLKEAGMRNSYLHQDKKKDTENMSKNPSLKELAAKLFMEDTTASAKHAADVSGVSPEVGTKDDLHEESDVAGVAGTVDAAALPGVGKAKEMPHDKGKPELSEAEQDKVIEEALKALDEEVEAEGHAGFGDSDEEPSVEFEVDEKELMEAISEYRKEKMKESKDKKAKEEAWEDAAPEGGKDGSQANLKEDFDVDFDDFSDDADVGGDMGMDDVGMDDMSGVEDVDGESMGMDMDVDVNFDMDDDVSGALDAAGIEDVDMSITGDLDVDLFSDGGDESVEAVDVASSATPVDGEEPMTDVTEESKMYEARIRKLVRALRESNKERVSYKKQADTLKTELKESNLFLAKNVFFTKVLQRGDVSRKNLERIVEYLDKAKTVSEAKSIYNKLKEKLNESASRKLAGSASKVTKPGSAATLKESASNRVVEGQQTTERWQELAGIRKKD
jgi:hypothetical protein